MLSNKPYILRAFYEWIVDSACTPIIVLDAHCPGCQVPKEFIEDGEVVLNISPSAVRDLKLGNERVEFRASFSGVVYVIVAPVKAVLAVYAEENDEGIFFERGEGETEGSVEASSHYSSEIVSSQPANIVQEKGKPYLRLVETPE